QGAFREHVEALTALGAHVALVKRPEHLDQVDAIFLPGGESTTIDKLLDSSELREPLARRLRDGLPAFATCAGLILCASEVLDGRPDQQPLAVLDVTVRRNGYGRQRESFETPLAVRGLADGDFPGVFIRAPVVDRVGAHVEVLAEHDGVAVLGRADDIWFASFHPELSGDLRLHQLFVNHYS
ncbi:MAG: pyridoxal 5-phosphate synthase pdxT subunit, partial [Actinomycetota bacterium]|nr:pyridoxal 5-phosphate synthase pdxT subunit [Actinomycetota bacterium]